MRKIVIEVETDSVDSIEELKRDIESELSCCSASFDFDTLKVYEKADTPQTDCSTCKWGEWYRNGRDITTMDDECGGCCSWNNKWQPKEPQTESKLTANENSVEIPTEAEDFTSKSREKSKLKQTEQKDVAFEFNGKLWIPKDADALQTEDYDFRDEQEYNDRWDCPWK